MVQTPLSAEPGFLLWLRRLTLLGLAARLLFVWLEPATAPVADERTWTNWAIEGLLSPRVHWSPLRTNMIFYPPLYPYFIAIPYAVFGTLAAVKISQAIVSALLVPAVGRLGAHAFGPRAGLGAAAIVAFYPDLVWFAAHFWSETLFMVFLWWGFELLFLADRRGSVLLAAASGALFGLSILTRETVLYFLPILGLWLAVRSVRPGGRLRALALCATAVAFVAPWTYRNYLRFHAFVPVSTAGGLNLYQGNARLTRQEVYDRYEAVQGRIEQYRFGMAMGVQAIKERQPLWFFEKIVEEMPNFWEADSLALIHIKRGAYGTVRPGLALAAAVVTIAPYLVVLALFVYGACRAPIDRAGLLLLAFLLFYLLLHIATHGFARYRLPAMPVLFIYAGYALTPAVRAVALDARRRVLAGAVGIVLGLSLVRSFRLNLEDPAFGLREPQPVEEAPAS